MKSSVIVGAVLVAAFLLACLAAGCGGSSGSTSSSGPDATSTTAAPPIDPNFAVDPQNKAIIRFGKEASSTEREAASAVLERNLMAREKGEWSVQCQSLSAFAIKQLQKEFGKSQCTQILQKGAEPLAKSKPARADTLDVRIDALRAEGPRAYALYHGTDGKDYAMKMEREPTGEWKVGSPLAIDVSVVKSSSGGAQGAAPSRPSG